MVVHHFNLKGIAILPAKHDPPLLINTDRVFASVVTLESLQPVAWWRSQIL